MNSGRQHPLLSARALLASALLAMLVTAGAAGIAPTAHAWTLGDASRQALAQANLQTAAGQDPPALAAVLLRASYGNIEASYNTVAVQMADLNMLLSTNVTCIRIDIGYAPWLQNNPTAISELTGLVNDVRAAGRCLIIADAASETYRKGGQLPWSQFMDAWNARVSTLAALYHPDYYIVIKEPGWYVPMVSDATTNPQFQNVSVWLGLTQNLANAVRAASPSTVVGVAIAANSLSQANGAFYADYLNRVQEISGVSFIGFDIYGGSDQKATQAYLSQNPPSKAVWLPEAWSTANGSAMDSSPSQDAQWIRSAYSFASSIDAAFLIPFYTDNFASYTLTTSPPTNSAEIISLYQQRTQVFSAFQSLAASAATQSSATSSSSGSSATATSTQSGTVTTTTTTSSPLTSQRSTTSQPSGGNGFFSIRVVILEVVILLALAVVVVYYRRRS
jgi:hypothetical protein